MGDKAKIAALKQQVSNLKRMNEILRRLVVSLSKRGPRSKVDEEVDKPRVH